jgi:hypothetical protein
MATAQEKAARDAAKAAAAQAVVAERARAQEKSRGTIAGMNIRSAGDMSRYNIGYDDDPNNPINNPPPGGGGGGGGGTPKPRPASPPSKPPVKAGPKPLPAGGKAAGDINSVASQRGLRTATKAGVEGQSKYVPTWPGAPARGLQNATRAGVEGSNRTPTVMPRGTQTAGKFANKTVATVVKPPARIALGTGSIGLTASGAKKGGTYQTAAQMKAIAQGSAGKVLVAKSVVQTASGAKKNIASTGSAKTPAKAAPKPVAKAAPKPSATQIAKQTKRL